MRLDGAMGTELLARGLRLGDAPERWVLERPDAVAAVHRAYAAAGAQALHTCTFGANAVRLEAVGLEGRADDVVRAAVGLARAAGPRWVVGDLGPTGQRLPLDGASLPGAEADQRRGLRRAHHALARRLLDAGVDALHVETLSDLREALVALEAALEATVAAGQPVPVWVSLTCRQRADLAGDAEDARGSGPGRAGAHAPRSGFETLAGDPAVPALSRLRAAGAQAVGLNCELQAPAMVALAWEAGAAGVGPLVLQPAAGQPRPAPVPSGPSAPSEEPSPGFVYDGDPDTFARHLVAAAGAVGPGPHGRLVRAVGGCCGTTPGWIRRLAAGLAEAASGPAEPPRARARRPTEG